MHRSKNADLQPTIATFTNALQVCWRAADLSRACRLMSLMTGRSIPSATSSSAGGTTEDPLQLATDTSAEASASRARPTEVFAPDARTVSTLLQTALATRDRGSIFRTLDIVAKLGFGQDKYDLRPRREEQDQEEDDGEAKQRAVRHRQREAREAGPHAFFWQFKLAEVVERSLERVLQGGEGHLSKEQRRELYDWRQTVLDWLEAKEHLGKANGGGGGDGDGEETMRKRREQLAAGGSYAAGRRYVARRASDKTDHNAAEGAARLNRKQRRMLARGDTIEPAVSSLLCLTPPNPHTPRGDTLLGLLSSSLQ